MRKFFVSALFAGSCVAAAIGLAAPPAFASTFTVTNGGDITASAPTFVLTDVATDVQITCMATFSGVAPDGTGLSGTGIFTITSVMFSNCTGPFNSTWSVRGTLGSFNALAYSDGITSGTLTGTSLTATGTDLFGTCGMGAQGALDNVTYHDGSLTIAADSPPTLAVSNTTGSGCAGLVNPGDGVTAEGTFTVVPAFQISSP